MPQTRMVSVRGPSSYSAGGFDVTLGDVDFIAASSGRMVAASIASSSQLTAQVVASSGNIATVMLHTASAEIADATDLSALEVNVIYQGV